MALLCFMAPWCKGPTENETCAPLQCFLPLGLGRKQCRQNCCSDLGWTPFLWSKLQYLFSHSGMVVAQLTGMKTIPALPNSLPPPMIQQCYRKKKMESLQEVWSGTGQLPYPVTICCWSFPANLRKGLSLPAHCSFCKESSYGSHRAIRGLG